MNVNLKYKLFNFLIICRDCNKYQSLNNICDFCDLKVCNLCSNFNDNNNNYCSECEIQFFCTQL